MRHFLLLLCIVLLVAQTVAAPPILPHPGPPPMPPPGSAPMVFAPAQDGLRIPGVGLPHYLSMPVMRQRNFSGDGTIHGVVMDADHDQPIPDAFVVLLSVEERRERWHTMARDRVEANSKGDMFMDLPLILDLPR